MNWKVDVTSRPDPMLRTQDLLIRVRVPDEVVLSLAHENVQHNLVEYIARTLHDFVTSENKTKRLKP